MTFEGDLKLIGTAILFVLGCISVHAEDWTTTDGKTYKSVTVVKVEDDAMTILNSDGGARVDFSKLPPELQKRYKYNPAKAKAASDARAQEDIEDARALQAEMNQASQVKREEAIQSANDSQLQAKPEITIEGKVVQALPDGMVFRKMDGQEVFVSCNSSGFAEGDCKIVTARRSGSYDWEKAEFVKDKRVDYSVSITKWEARSVIDGVEVAAPMPTARREGAESGPAIPTPIQ